jgi:choline kinase/phosphatidylglycerophosphate synthase
LAPRTVARATLWPARPATAVVLAAGRSERLSACTDGRSKAGLRVGGLALLERTLLLLLSKDIESVVVVVGHDAERVARIAVRAGRDRVRVVRSEQWQLGNGCSLEAAEPAVDPEQLFLLLVADHVFEPATLDPLLEIGRPAALVDPQPTPEILAEATRVVVSDGAALAFGKQVESTWVDCGAFLVPPRIFECQREASAQGDHSLAGAISTLARRQPLEAVPRPSGSWWVDVDTPEDLRAARRRVRESLVKPTDGPVARLLNRQLSTRLSVALARLPLAPDLVTLAVFLLGMLAAFQLAGGGGLAGGLLAQLASVLDGVDGELARLRFRTSPRGAVLDSVLDRLADAAILAGLGLWTLRDLSPSLALPLTAATVAGAFLSMALKDRVAALGLPPLPERVLGCLLGGRDGRLFLVAVCAIAGQPLAALAAVVVTSALAAAARLALIWRMPPEEARAAP